eukprot:741049-Rhodomonas_salina.2
MVFVPGAAALYCTARGFRPPLVGIPTRGTTSSSTGGAAPRGNSSLTSRSWALVPELPRDQALTAQYSC